MRHRSWGLLLIVPVLASLLVVLTAPFPSFHQHLEFAGTPGRFADAVVRAGRADARGALWLDIVAAIAWIVVVPRLLRAGLERWAPERRRRFGPWAMMPRVALAAGLLDLAGTALTIVLIGNTSPPTVLVLALAVLSWLMWALYVVAAIGVFGLVVGPLFAPVLRPALRALWSPLDGLAGRHADPVVPTGPPPERSAERIGICLSGGGVRAASVAVGALRSLDAETPTGRSLFRRARWLVAVSGGAYTAGGWRISRRPGARIEPSPTTTRDGLFDAGGPWSATVRRRRRFLDNGRGSLLGGIVGLMARAAVVFAAVLAAAFTIGWAAGRLVRTHAVHPRFPITEVGEDRLLTLRDLLPMRLVVPGALALIVAGVLVVVALGRPDAATRARFVRSAAIVAGLGALLVGMLVGVPIGVVYGRRFLAALPVAARADGGAGVLGVLSAIGVIGAIAGIALAEFKRRWMRLGGVVLAIGVFLFAGKVADTAARGLDGRWSSWGLPGVDVGLPVVAVALVWLGIVDSIASHRLTLGGLYRKRLAATFALADGDRAPLAPLPYQMEPSWDGYRDADGPELVIVATAHATEDTFGGLPAYGFTFRPDRITLHDRTDGSSATVAPSAYPTGCWWDGFPRGWIVSRSMALTGAAIASAMGRQALGTTNALLVSFNLRLGAWVPNPRFTQWFSDPAGTPRVHLGYLVKELFNRYHPERDAFVYVADGGHRENLGLVELLRERPDTVVCIDASGDRPGTFQTLSEAIGLALTELHIDIDIDLDPVRPQGDRVPVDCVAEGLIRYPAALGGGTARLLYGRSQLSEAAPAHLLRFGGSDRRFPSYSTADQFLTEDEHDQLVALGEHVGDRILGLFEGSPPSIPGRV